MAIMEGSDPQQKLKKSWFPGLQANWLLWPAVQAVNFKLVPLHHRVLVVNLVSLGMLSLSIPYCYRYHVANVDTPRVELLLELLE